MPADTFRDALSPWAQELLRAEGGDVSGGSRPDPRNVITGPREHAFTAFVGVNLLQSGLTKWCLMESIMRKLGAKQGA